MTGVTGSPIWDVCACNGQICSYRNHTSDKAQPVIPVMAATRMHGSEARDSDRRGDRAQTGSRCMHLERSVGELRYLHFSSTSSAGPFSISSLGDPLRRTVASAERAPSRRVGGGRRFESCRCVDGMEGRSVAIAWTACARCCANLATTGLPGWRWARGTRPLGQLWLAGLAGAG